MRIATGRCFSDDDRPLGICFASRMSMRRPTRSVVAVSGDPARQDIIDALLAEENNCDVIYVEPIPRAYSRIRKIFPHVIVIFCDMEDAAACQLLSMLKIDPALAGIPVLTWATPPSGYDFERIVSDLLADPPLPANVLQMN